MPDKIKKLGINREFDKYNIGFGKIEEGNIISFNYHSPNVNDNSPVVYVMERKGNSIYALNIRYKPDLYSKLIDEKLKELEKNINKAMKKQGGEREKAIESLEQKDMEVFELPVSKSQTKDILRRYMKNRMTNLKRLKPKVE